MWSTSDVKSLLHGERTRDVKDAPPLTHTVSHGPMEIVSER
jgi:hypothetical protein